MNVSNKFSYQVILEHEFGEEAKRRFHQQFKGTLIQISWKFIPSSLYDQTKTLFCMAIQHKK